MSSRGYSGGLPADEVPLPPLNTPQSRPTRAARLLHLERDADVSGVSGTGVVAFGCEFPDGTIVLRWDTQVASTVFYSALRDLELIVGHGGRTRIVFDDEAAS
jgi:hypothetical protein